MKNNQHIISRESGRPEFNTNLPIYFKGITKIGLTMEWTLNRKHAHIFTTIDAANAIIKTWLLRTAKVEAR